MRRGCSRGDDDGGGDDDGDDDDGGDDGGDDDGGDVSDMYLLFLIISVSGLIVVFIILLSCIVNPVDQYQQTYGE